jgi:hypothetical protein
MEEGMAAATVCGGGSDGDERTRHGDKDDTMVTVDKRLAWLVARVTIGKESLDVGA